MTKQNDHNELVIDVQNINKSFGERHVVKNLSLQVKKGEIFGFLGPNGSGKTTSIRMMCGLLTPDSGSGTCLGYDILTQSEEIKRHVGYMTQRFSFWEDLTIRENLDFVARIYEMPNRMEAVERSLNELGLANRSDQLAGALSGGWKQRLALAACMLHKPSLLLLDEPTAGVDPKARRDFWDQIHALAATGISILVSTHYMDEAERCDKLAYIANGKLLITGSAAEVIATQGLTTFSITGPGINTLSEKLNKVAAVKQTVVFGNSLHVTGIDSLALESSLQQAIKGTSLKLEKIDTGLEDVFVHLMEQNKDTYGIES